MVRFINIGGQIIDGYNQFAWYDTVSDSFISFNDYTVFDSWIDFENTYQFEKNPHSPLDRFKNLFPEDRL